MNGKKTIIGLGALLLAAAAISWLLARFAQQPAERTQQGTRQSGTFAAATEGLPDVQESAIVELEDGARFDLTAIMARKEINGQPVKMLAYNGSIPGPLIKVHQGSEITVNFTNKTDVETTIHSHGVRLANAFDGTPDVTQEPVPVGGTFSYTLNFPDAGVFWYHPHVREDYAQELGLYGNYLVVPAEPAYWSPVNREVALMIDDILIENGRIAPFDRSVADHVLMGRFGNIMMVNGETDYNLNAKQGEVVRFYLTNTASTRTFNVTIPNAKMKLVGADGGKYERETFVDSVIISPSERAILEVLFDHAGTYTLQHKTPEKSYALGTITVGSEKDTPSYVSQFNTLRTNQDVIANIDLFRSAFDKISDKKLALTIDMMDMGNMGGNMMSGDSGGHGDHIVGSGQMMSNQMMMGGSGDPIEWEDTNSMLNQMSTTQMMQWKITDEATNEINMDINWKFKVGDRVKMSIFNDPKSAHPMQHPIHLHGQRFLTLSTNGIKNDNLVWKDSVLIKNGDTVELLVDMSNSGQWMAHCHIAEHLEDGMMFSFEVSP